ncbi:MAG: polyprenol monophosphomannose synthase [Victivallales bacterium]|jgi:dolichol-phosphate mannosyltransferase|nr:polyprenol monophosphomannose synthase [Victivallales bacterium]
MIKYSIVIPTLNEKENILLLIDRIEKCGLSNYEIIVADENSPDGTAEAVNAYAAAGHDYVRAVLNDGIPGLSPSIVKGFKAAQGEFLCCMDGDLQHDTADLIGLLNELESCDFAIGSRYVQGGGFREKWNPFRVLISRSAAAMAHLVLGIKVKDPMSGFFALRREAFERISPRLSPKGFKIMLELLYLLSTDGKPCRVVEHGITFGRREHGKSKLSAKVMLDYLRMLFALRFSKHA